MQTEQTLTDQFLVVRVDLIQEARTGHQDPVVAGALHEHPPLLEVGRPHPPTASASHQTEGLPPCEHVAGLPVHQHDLLLGRDDLRLGELVEASASLEDERVALDKLPDAASVWDVEDLKPGGMYRHQPVGPSCSVTDISSPAYRAATLQSVEQQVELPVDGLAGPQLGLVVVESVAALLPEADRHHEVHHGAELVQPQVESVRQRGERTVECSY